MSIEHNVHGEAEVRREEFGAVPLAFGPVLEGPDRPRLHTTEQLQQSTLVKVNDVGISMYNQTAKEI